jgi:hypothetical protein
MAQAAQFFGMVSAWLLASIAAGFILNRFVLAPRLHGRVRAVALAVSRAVFYAPALVDVGHGVYIPSPLLLDVGYSFSDFGPELDVLSFLLPVTVLLGSLAVSRDRLSGGLFCGLEAGHLAVFGLLPLTFSSYDAAMDWLDLNQLPAWPLERFDLPDGLVWAWCLAAWAALYGLLALALARLVRMARGRGQAGRLR